MWTQTERIKTRVKSVGNQTFSFDSHLNAMNGISDEKPNNEFLENLIESNEEVVTESQTNSKRTERLRTKIKIGSEVEDYDSDFVANDEELKNNTSDEEWTEPQSMSLNGQHFRCNFKGCSSVLRSRTGLQRHERLHKQKGSHFCDYEGCGYRALNKFQLHSHKKFHSSDYTFECLYENCHRMFKAAKPLRRHQRDVHKIFKIEGQTLIATESLYECKFNGCSTKFNNYKSFLIHKKSHGKQQLKCSEDGCNYTTLSKFYLIRHRFKVHSQEGPFILLSGNSFKMKEDYNRYTCPQKPIEPHVCDHIGCGLEFKDRKALLTHKQIHGAPQFQCEWEDCSAVFTHKYGFNRHMNRHKGVFKCDFDGCEYSALDNSRLRKHMIPHSEDKTFRCSVNGCQHSYKFAHGLRDHKLTAHPLEFEDVPWIECIDSGCDYKTKSTKQMRAHMTVHIKSHICDVCQKHFGNPRQLKQHLSVHTDVRYPCDWPGCDMAFKRMSYLKEHRNVHTNENIFTCDWPGCDKTFLLRNSKNLHMIRHKERNERTNGCSICGTNCATPLQHEIPMKTHENQPKEPSKLVTKKHPKPAKPRKPRTVKKDLNLTLLQSFQFN